MKTFEINFPWNDGPTFVDVRPEDRVEWERVSNCLTEYGYGFGVCLHFVPPAKCSSVQEVVVQLQENDCVL